LRLPRLGVRGWRPFGFISSLPIVCDPGTRIGRRSRGDAAPHAGRPSRHEAHRHEWGSNALVERKRTRSPRTFVTTMCIPDDECTGTTRAPSRTMSSEFACSPESLRHVLTPVRKQAALVRTLLEELERIAPDASDAEGHGRAARRRAGAAGVSDLRMRRDHDSGAPRAIRGRLPIVRRGRSRPRAAPCGDARADVEPRYHPRSLPPRMTFRHGSS
jgi:hypothetical protein